LLQNKQKKEKGQPSERETREVFFYYQAMFFALKKEKNMTFQSIQFAEENIKFTNPSWDEMQEIAFELSKKILADGYGAQPDKKIDRIITLAKGGWPMTRSLVDYLQVQHVASIGVKFYAGINQKLSQPEIYQDLPVSVEGETVLLFDDVADSGESLEFVQKYLLAKNVKKVVTATLFYKPHSKIKPDYFGAETKDWIIFPYDAVESIKILGDKWAKNGREESEILNRFKALGFNKNIIEYYF
jgi:uncharacterized protein